MSKKQKQQKQTHKEKEDASNGKDQALHYMKYAGMAFQIGIIILIGTFIGKKLDARFEMERPYLTVVFALISIFAALYLSLKDLLKQK